MSMRGLTSHGSWSVQQRGCSLDRRLDCLWAHDATGVPVKSKVGSPMDFSATAARLMCPDVTLADALIQFIPTAPRPAGTSETGCGAATPLGPEWVVCHERAVCVRRCGTVR